MHVADEVPDDLHFWMASRAPFSTATSGYVQNWAASPMRGSSRGLRASTRARCPKLSSRPTMWLVRNGYHHHQVDELAANPAGSEPGSIYKESVTDHETSARGSRRASSRRKGVN